LRRRVGEREALRIVAGHQIRLQPARLRAGHSLVATWVL
jgi:hypothetical protein